MASTRSPTPCRCGYHHLLCHMQVPQPGHQGCWWTPGSCLPDVQLCELLQLLLHVLLQLPRTKKDLADGADRSLTVKQSCFLFACEKENKGKSFVSDQLSSVSSVLYFGSCPGTGLKSRDFLMIWPNSFPILQSVGQGLARFCSSTATDMRVSQVWL